MKSIEMKAKEFTELMEMNGFRYSGKTTYDGKFIYEREWKGSFEVAWYGKCECSFKIEASESFGYPLIRIYKNGREIDRRDYSSAKRAINAMKEIVRNAGFEF